MPESILAHTPSQFDDESLISKGLSNDFGAITSIARLCQRTPSAFSQQFDPHNEGVKAWWHLGKLQLWAITAINPTLGRVLFSDLQRCGDLWLSSSTRQNGKPSREVVKTIARMGVALQAADAEGDTEEVRNLAAKIGMYAQNLVTSLDGEHARSRPAGAEREFA